LNTNFTLRKQIPRTPVTKTAITGKIRINESVYAGKSALKYQEELFIFKAVTYI
jgi:hypothetical protein